MKETVLVVEDDSAINEVVCEFLKEAGLEVATFANGDDALKFLASAKNLSICIFDIMLPGASGLELLKEARQSALFSHVPVIMLTALDDELTQLSSFNGLADDYVTKPFSPRILVKRVEALLRRSGEYTDGEILKAGPLLIHTGNYEAYEGGERIDLTLKELELLKAFIGTPRKVFTRQRLLDLVWGSDYYGDERIVDVHIKNIRKKLTGNFIATVKGVGYKLDPNYLKERDGK